jgi:PAS domain S-box-containing protein
LDTDLRFVKVNALLAEIHGRSVEEHLGRTVREVLPELADHLEPLFRKILETNTPIRNMEIQGLGPKAPALQRHFLASYFPVKDAEVRYLNGIVVEVTERKRAEDAVRQLSGRLLQLQDEERRRIGSELHDATAQELATAAMDLGRVQQRIAGHDATVDALLSDCQALLAECSRKVRTLSYQLHPPLLDEVGLAGAVQDYARGFMQRSGLQVTLDLCPALGRLTPHIERALFRVVQECLGNVHRHSGSPTAQVRIRRAGSGVVLEITDQGRGFAPEVRISDDGAVSKVGVGITGMRERLRQLGGQLEIESSQQGTTVRATVPGGSEPEQDHAVSDRQ